MGRNKHYKLGKTKVVLIPEAIASEINELVRELDKLKDPSGAIALFRQLLDFKEERL